MPICLTNPHFRDTSIKVTSVGVGLLKEGPAMTQCTTDARGPEVFAKCANIWTLSALIE